MRKKPTWESALLRPPAKDKRAKIGEFVAKMGLFNLWPGERFCVKQALSQLS
ncbi:MAG: hypothetical protein HQ553_17270 [Chloroflexi bacterium]|nr:hypothetical protein [Chloroflexota bacterium]